MLGILIDAAVLIGLLKIINDDDVGLGTACIVALVASLGTAALAFGLVSVMGISGLFVASLLAAALLGVAVSAMFGVEIKRSFLIAGLFMLVHLAVGIGFQMLLH